jgi:hypothetical protein
VFHGETHREKIRLRGQDIEAEVGEVNLHILYFYPENPRIYSIVCSEDKEPSQEEIFEKLRGMEHVKQLVQSIRANGGLHDPIIVRNNVVLEGNSRLAAYKLLAEKDPVAWGLIKAKVLPADTGEDLVFALLGEYHLIGKKDWAPYEQAGYLFRRHYHHKIDIKTIAVESGLSHRTVSHLIAVYKYMREKNQNDVNRWSYFDEYLKSRDIKKIRDDFSEIDDVVIEKINSGEISRAADIRDKLKVIAKSKVQNIRKFVKGERDFETAFESASDQGLSSQCYNKLYAFRNYICDLDTEKAILDLEAGILDKCLFEIKKIHKRTENLQKKLNEK